LLLTDCFENQARLFGDLVATPVLEEHVRSKDPAETFFALRFDHFTADALGREKPLPEHPNLHP
jgi:hypothetical protein